MRRSTLLVLLAFLGCGKEGYLFVQPPAVPTRKVDETYKIRETVKAEGKIDILWVIDNSSSMYTYQTAVIQNTKTFIDAFTQRTGIDWKMGIISTDQDNRPFIGFEKSDQLNFKTLNPVNLFQNAVRRLGTNGSGTEKTFTPILNSLRDYPDFTRSDAVLAIISLTDAKEQSRMDARDFLADVIKVKGTIEKVIMYGIYPAADFGCKPTSEGRWDYKGSPYEVPIVATGGQAFKMCDPFGPSLAQIGKDIVKRIDLPRIPLRSRPVSGTLHVFFLDKELPGGPKENGGLWFYDFEFNAIVFYDLKFAPGENEKIHVIYDEERIAS